MLVKQLKEGVLISGDWFPRESLCLVLDVKSWPILNAPGELISFVPVDNSKGVKEWWFQSSSIDGATMGDTLINTVYRDGCIIFDKSRG